MEEVIRAEDGSEFYCTSEEIPVLQRIAERVHARKVSGKPYVCQLAVPFVTGNTYILVTCRFDATDARPAPFGSDEGL